MSKRSRGIRSVLLAAGVGLGMSAAPVALANGTGVFVNGVELTVEQVAFVYGATGQVPVPGHYLFANGCVAHLESGQVMCGGAGGALGGGAGVGPGAGGGSWFHRGSDYGGGYSVGGDGSGCIYTPDWSNC